MGVELGPDEVAYRCNLVTLSDDDAAGHGRLRGRSHLRARRAIRSSPRSTPRSATAATACASIPASSTAICASCPSDWGDAECTPPHDLTGQPAVFPTGPARAEAARADGRVARGRARRRARRSASSATQIWLWGQGVKPALPRFDDDVRRRRPDVVGRRSRAGSRRAHRHRGRRRARRDRRLRQRLRARRRARASRSLADRDLFVLHVEATDEAGHQGLADVKVDALERWDTDVIGPIVDALDAGSRAVPDPAAARSRDAVHDQDAHAPSPCRTCCSTRRATRRGRRVHRARDRGERAGRRHTR